MAPVTSTLPEASPGAELPPSPLVPASAPAWVLVCILALGTAVKVAEAWWAPELFFDYEELSRGLLARELLDGPAMGLLDYQGDPYAGGSLVLGLFAVPVFALFGDSIFSLSLATLPCLWLSALVTWQIFDRYLDRSLAPLGAALVFLAPYPASRLALVAWGDSVQAPFFFILTWMLVLRMLGVPRLDGKPAPRGPGWTVVLGVVAGFGAWFHYHTLIPLALITGLMLAVDRRQVLKAALPGLVGFAVGFSPWVAHGLTHDFEALQISSYGSMANASAGGLADYPGRLLSLLTTVPAASVGPGPATWPWAHGASVVLWGLFVVGLAGLVRQDGPALAAVVRGALRGQPAHALAPAAVARTAFVVYPVFFAVVAAATGFSFVNEPAWYFADRYLASVHGALWVLVPLAAARLWRSGFAARRVLGAALLGGFLGVGAVAQGVLLFGAPPVRPVPTRGPDGSWMSGSSYQLLSDDRIAFAWYRGDLADNLSHVRDSRGERRRHLGLALGLSLAWRTQADLLRIEEILESGSLETDDARLVWSGVGMGVGRWHGDRLGEVLDLPSDDPRSDWVLEGLILVENWQRDDPVGAVNLVKDVVPSARQARFLRSIGSMVARHQKRDLKRILAALSSGVPDDAAKEVAAGVCEDLGPNRSDPARLAADLDLLVGSRDAVSRQLHRCLSAGPGRPPGGPPRGAAPRRPPHRKGQGGPPPAPPR